MCIKSAPIKFGNNRAKNVVLALKCTDVQLEILFICLIPIFNFVQESGIIWDEKNLNDYLKHPDKFVHGTKKKIQGN